MERYMNRVLTFLVAVLLWSCTFDLDETFVNPLPPPPATITVVVELEDPEPVDPYFLSQPTTFRLLALTPKPPIYISVTLGTSEVSPVVTKGNYVEFTLQPAAITPGTYDLKIQMLIGTGSGSLADQANQEYYEVNRTYKVVVDPAVPSVTAPFVAHIVDGYMRLDWSVSKAYPYTYILRKYRLTGTSETLVRETSLVSESPAHWLDSGYVGGRYRYRLLIRQFNGDQLVATADAWKSAATFQLITGPGQSHSLQVTPHFTSASLSLVSAGGTIEYPFLSATLPLDTLYLGDTRTYRLLVRRNAFQEEAYDTTLTYSKAQLITAFTDAQVVAGANKLLLSVNGDLQRFHATTFVLEESLRSYISLTNVTQISAGHNAQFTCFPLRIVNPLNLSQTTWYEVYRGDLSNGFEDLFVQATSSHAGNQLVGHTALINGSPSAVIADPSLYSDPPSFQTAVWFDSTRQDLPTVSSDGQVFVVNHATAASAQVFRKVASLWVEQGNVPRARRFFRTSPAQELLVADGTTLKVFNISGTPGAGNSYVPIRTFPFPSVPAGSLIADYGYDIAADVFWVQSRNNVGYSTIRTFDPDTFVVLERAVALLPPGTPHRHLYRNGFHFLTSGYVEQIQP